VRHVVCGLQGQFGRRCLCSLGVVFIVGGSRQSACPEFPYKANHVYVLFIPSDVSGVCQHATAAKLLLIKNERNCSVTVVRRG
jgi:hypothetical protein